MSGGSSEEELMVRHVDPTANINYPNMPATGVKYVEQATLADLAEIEELYKHAEKIYPYSNLRLSFDRNPHSARRADLALETMLQSSPRPQMRWFFLGLVSFAFFSRRPVFNSLTYSKHPIGSLAWGLGFFSVATYFRSVFYRVNDHELKSALVANRQTHGYIKTLRRHIETRGEIPMESLY